VLCISACQPRSTSVSDVVASHASSRADRDAHRAAGPLRGVSVRRRGRVRNLVRQCWPGGTQVRLPLSRARRACPAAESAPADAGCERSFRRARRCGIFPRRGAPWSRHGWAATAASPTRWSIGSQATCVCPPAPSSVHVEQCEPAPLSCSAQRLLDRTGAAQQGALPIPCVATRCSMLRVIPPEAGRRPAMSRRRAASRCQRRCVLRPRGHLKRPFDQSQERGLLTSLKTGVRFRAGVPLRLSARTRAHAALSATRSQAWGL
jgi:hypothetical protein